MTQTIQQINQIAALKYVGTLAKKYEHLSGPMPMIALATMPRAFGADIADQNSLIATSVRRIISLMNLMDGELAALMTYGSIQANIVPPEEIESLIKELRELSKDVPELLQKLVNNEA